MCVCTSHPPYPASCEVGVDVSAPWACGWGVSAHASPQEPSLLRVRWLPGAEAHLLSENTRRRGCLGLPAEREREPVASGKTEAKSAPGILRAGNPPCGNETQSLSGESSLVWAGVASAAGSTRGPAHGAHSSQWWRCHIVSPYRMQMNDSLDTANLGIGSQKALCEGSKGLTCGHRGKGWKGLGQPSLSPEASCS